MLRQIAFALFVSAAVVASEAQEFEVPKPAPEHEFLKRFVGEWVCDNEAYMISGQPPMTSKGSMTGKMLGDFWVIQGSRYVGV